MLTSPDAHVSCLQLDRSVNVDFNSLDIIVNVESWVVILDFFGLGPESHNKQEAPVHATEPVERSAVDKGEHK